ncbi:type II secretion system protein GspL [Fontimonas sp. SYSU GA230001]|uniref:type II secretion system protein GspL n=1 Tax=Fontimonas sp. SYSU GA230001 TaxID=3142450 RepID=UPI0032B552DA
MRETLYIRLRAAEPAAPTAYCIAGHESVASFAIEQAPLADVIALAAGRRTVVLVPSADVRLTTVELPARQIAKVLQAVPFAVEEQFADDVETLHFALGTRQADGSWPVAAVARTRMSHWLSVFAERGVRPDAVIPDLLTLPVPADNELSLLFDDEEVLVRSGVSAGFVCHRDDLQFCLQLIDPQRGRVLRTLIPRDVAFDPSTLPWAQEALHGFPHPLAAMLQGIARHPHIDLLQGEFSPRQDLLRLWRPWRLSAALAGAAVTIAAGAHAIDAYRVGHELAELRARNQQRYQQVFPSETRIVDLEAQLDQQFARLSGGSANGGLLPLMQVVADAAAAVPGLNVQALQFRDGALYVSLTAGSLQVVDQLKTWFEGGRAARMEVQAANAGSEGVQIRIKLVPA